MRPKSTSADLPSAYDVKVHLHNQFVKHMKALKEDITVRNSGVRALDATHLNGRKPPERYRSLSMGGLQTPQRPGFKE